jgi:hypothetical protein
MYPDVRRDVRYLSMIQKVALDKRSPTPALLGAKDRHQRRIQTTLAVVDAAATQ